MKDWIHRSRTGPVFLAPLAEICWTLVLKNVVYIYMFTDHTSTEQIR